MALAVAESASAVDCAKPNFGRGLVPPSTDDNVDCWRPPTPSHFAVADFSVADARPDGKLSSLREIQSSPACFSSMQTAPNSTLSARDCKTASSVDSARRTSTTSLCTSACVAATAPDASCRSRSVNLRAMTTTKFDIEPVMNLWRVVVEFLEYLRSNQAVVFAPPSVVNYVDKR